MYLLTYSFHSLGSSTIYYHMALTADPVGWLIRKRREDPSVCIVWMHELEPLERRKLDVVDLKAMDIEQ